MKNKYLLLFSVLFSLLIVNVYADEFENSETKEAETTEAKKTLPDIVPEKPKRHYRNMFELGGTAYYGFQNYEFEEPSGITLAMNNIDLRDNGFLYSANLKYKIYFTKTSRDTFFMAPEFMYGFGSIESGDTLKDTSDISLSIKPTYGFKLSLGFESDGKYSFSIGAGVQNISYDYTYHADNYNETGEFWAPFLAIDFQRNIAKYLYIGFNFHYYLADFDLKNSQIGLYTFPEHFFFKEVEKLEGNIVTAGISLGFRF